MVNRPNCRQRGWLAISAWWDMRRRLARLGSVRDHEREATIDWFVAQGPRTSFLLRRALRASVSVACGAALALYRQGEDYGIRTVLRRCYAEDWLRRCLQDGHLAELNALRRLGRWTLGAVLMAALDDAAREQDARACVETLTVSLSALQVLAVFDDVSPQVWWKRAARFGPAALRGLGDVPVLPVTRNLLASIRMEAIIRLRCEHKGACSEMLIDALNSEDEHVVLTAIEALQWLRDRRALPHLYRIAFGDGHTLAAQARRAIEGIEGNRADALILMRAAQAPQSQGTLLRAAAHGNNMEHETLVRAST